MRPTDTIRTSLHALLRLLQSVAFWSIGALVVFAIIGIGTYIALSSTAGAFSVAGFLTLSWMAMTGLPSVPEAESLTRGYLWAFLFAGMALTVLSSWVRDRDGSLELAALAGGLFTFGVYAVIKRGWVGEPPKYESLTIHFSRDNVRLAAQAKARGVSVHQLVRHLIDTVLEEAPNRADGATLPPFPCGKPRPFSLHYSGYADPRGVMQHYETCPHPVCQVRFEVTRDLLGEEVKKETPYEADEASRRYGTDLLVVQLIREWGLARAFLEGREARATLPPFPCGKPSPFSLPVRRSWRVSLHYSGYADLRGVMQHYETCPHPVCQARFTYTRDLLNSYVEIMERRRREQDHTTAGRDTRPCNETLVPPNKGEGQGDRRTGSGDDGARAASQAERAISGPKSPEEEEDASRIAATSAPSKFVIPDNTECGCGHRRKFHFKAGKCFMQGCSCRMFSLTSY